MSRPVRTPAVVAAAALLLVAAASGAAAADSSTRVQVSANNDPGSRQFFVEDLTGRPLTTLDLGTGAQGLPFQTRVKDTDYTSDNGGFVAGAEMTNLYRKGPAGIDYGVKVASEKLSIGYAGTPSDVSGLAVGALPKIRLAGLLPLCKDLPRLLPSTSPLLAPLDPATRLPLLSGLPGTLSSIGLTEAAAPLCSALGGVTGSTPVSVQAADNALVTLDEKVLQPALDALDQQPLSFTGSTQSGRFTAPSFLGDGAGDPAKTDVPATALTLLAGQKNRALDLEGLLGPVLDGLPLFPAVPGGTGAVTEVSNVVASLQSATGTAVTAVGTQLAGLSEADQTGVLAGLRPLTASLPIASLFDAKLTRLSGQYRSFPQLKADLSGAAAGTYTGTMTVTFVQR